MAAVEGLLGVYGYNARGSLFLPAAAAAASCSEAGAMPSEEQDAAEVTDT